MAPMSLVNAPTPLSRVVRLLNAALPLLDDHPALKFVKEAHAAAGGMDVYMEKYSTPLIVPKTHAVPESEVHAVFNSLLEATENEDWAQLYKDKKTTWELTSGMCSGAYEATFIQHVALDSNAASVLEIGLFTGTTTLALGLLPKVKKVVALDIEPFLETFDRPYWERAGVSSKIETRFGPAVDSLHKLKAEGHQQFDIAFIDADKPSYLTYVNLLLELDLLAPNGIILADNVLYKGYTYAESDHHVSPSANISSNNRSPNEATQGIRDFNEGIRANPNLHVVMLPIRDGVSIIRRKT